MAAGRAAPGFYRRGAHAGVTRRGYGSGERPRTVRPGRPRASRFILSLFRVRGVLCSRVSRRNHPRTLPSGPLPAGHPGPPQLRGGEAQRPPGPASGGSPHPEGRPLSLPDPEASGWVGLRCYPAYPVVPLGMWNEERNWRSSPRTGVRAGPAAR